MKKLFPAFAALALLVSACNKETHGDANVHITGNVKGFKSGKLFIKREVDTSLVNIDTIEVDGNSAFESYLKLESPEMLYLVIDRGTTESIDDNLKFFAEPGTVNIETTLDYFYSKAKITGSKNHDKYEEFKKVRARFTDEHLDLLQKNIEATAVADVARLDSIAAAEEQNQKRRYLYTANFALKNGKYEVAPYIALSEIQDINTKYLDTIQKGMTKKVAASKYGRMLTKYVADRKKYEAEAVK
ncbi:DUF4369 domain-containing protein [Flavobacterium sp. RHBU_24]|uniref:DUF4369 domain-containing protein n=1 Tax=Flavobacterium sp. RHBU_24 TaxID=3391185 RepID=UPI003984BD31